MGPLQQADRFGLLDEASVLGAKVLAGRNHALRNGFLPGVMLCDAPVCRLAFASEHALTAHDSAYPCRPSALTLMHWDVNPSPSWQNQRAQQDDLMRRHGSAAVLLRLVLILGLSQQRGNHLCSAAQHLESTWVRVSAMAAFGLRCALLKIEGVGK